MIYKEKDYPVDGIMFDVDGTLWDSTEVVAESWNRALKDTGHTLTVDADRLKGLFGLPMIDIFKNIMPEATKEEFEEFEDLCNRYEEEQLKKEPGAIYEGISEVIKKLSRKYKVFIISNCQSGYIEIVMHHLGIEEYITDYTCPGDSGLLKAANIKMMADKHGIKCPVYVGDTHMDEMACQEADVPIVFATYGFGKVETPVAVINTPKELEKIF